MNIIPAVQTETSSTTMEPTTIPAVAAGTIAVDGIWFLMVIICIILIGCIARKLSECGVRCRQWILDNNNHTDDEMKEKDEMKENDTVVIKMDV